MNTLSSFRRRTAVLAALAPLPVVAVAVAFGWAWWVALIPVAVVVIVIAEVVGLAYGVMAALLATAGLVLVVERNDDAGTSPHNGVELVAMAVLLLAAVLFGRDRPTG